MDDYCKDKKDKDKDNPSGGEMGGPSSLRCSLLLCASVCLAQGNEYVIGTALLQNP